MLRNILFYVFLMLIPIIFTFSKKKVELYDFYFGFLYLSIQLLLDNSTAVLLKLSNFSLKFRKFTKKILLRNITFYRESILKRNNDLSEAVLVKRQILGLTTIKIND
ncbi:hypothetical protein BpHYR1_009767 [Brachionus plicatilis]|uniref:Uncharacterized protein n=1 Tax=Brachionus plicatilis TaxID=10195 RepID=A0A3M7TA84_BRAPC|nr:hypothetical protein BpHYR1_009767 [Brachionus plicatilis]